MENNRVLLGMSGGIDSSVAAVLLKHWGYEPVGVSFILCNNSDSVAGAKLVTQRLEIEHHFYDASERFKQTVIQYFFDEYLSGRTPNPCVRCNQLIKWPLLFSLARNYDCHFVATGHYAQKFQVGDNNLLRKAFDRQKDQTHFLWGITSNDLNKILFPLGNLTKNTIISIAQNHSIRLDKKQKSSVGLCFVESDYRSTIKKLAEQTKTDIQPGVFYDIHGNWLGRHKGIAFYTVGQNKGLGLNLNRRFFVHSIDAKTNAIVLSDFKSLMKDKLILENFRLHLPVDDGKTEVEVRVRYRGKSTTGTVIQHGDLLHIKLSSPEWGIAPGQSVSLYHGDILVGGGFIVDE
ncbi:MAG TPA: tRNA 2-thiouridine(34) synthase MnmA [Salinivirgaceae bacterium]|nr:tRNA 2-thiouridine(34) synthase MnmA [Salinivirgaceae bacterium]